MLAEDSEHALDGAQDGTVDNDRAHEVALVVLVLELELDGQLEVELDGGTLVLALQSIKDLPHTTGTHMLFVSCCCALVVMSIFCLQ